MLTSLLTSLVMIIILASLKNPIVLVSPLLLTCPTQVKPTLSFPYSLLISEYLNLARKCDWWHFKLMSTDFKGALSPA